MAKKKGNEPRHERDFENMSEQAVLERVIDDLRTSEEFQAPAFEKFRRFYKLYRSYIAEEDKKENRSNLFIPYTFQIIETVTPKLVLSLFSSRPYVQTVPIGLDNATRTLRAKKMNKLLDYQLERKIKIVPVFTSVIKTIAMYGTGITKQCWEFKEKEVVKRVNKVIDGLQIPKSYDTILVRSVVKDDPNIISVPLLDFFFDPAGTTIEDSRYCIHRYWVDLHELKEKNEQSKTEEYPKGLYMNLDKLKNSSTSSNDSTGGNAAMLAEIGISSAKSSNKSIEILEYWTDDWVVKVANREYPVYSQRNPYFHLQKPFSKWVYTEIPNEFYGMGEIESIESLQEELNTTRNQRIDNVSFVLNKMWKILRGANIDTTQLISRPAGFIEVDEMTDVEEIQFTDVTASGYNEETIIKGDIDTTTGVHDTERGSTPQRRETATTMNILSTASGARFKLKTLAIAQDGMGDCINQIIRLNQQYIDREKELLILGNDGQLESDVVTPEDIAGEWDIVAVGSAIEPAVNKESKQSQLVQLYNVVKDRPDVNHQQLLKAIFEVFDMRNIEQMFMQMPQMQPGMPMPMSPSAMPPTGGMMNGGVING